MYAMLISCTTDSLPPLGSYLDLMDRLWTQPEASQKTGRKDLFPKAKNSKPSKKPGKGKKIPNKHAGITDFMADYALSHEEFPFHYEERLQQVFRLAALIPSLRDGLFPADGVNSVSAIVSLREFKTINPDIPVRDICLDSAHDNYATYRLCQS